jgi:hypothetical protein
MHIYEASFFVLRLIKFNCIYAIMGRLKVHNREELAEKLIEWAQLDDSINLNKFCAINMITPSKISLYASENDLFRSAYEYAKACIAHRREEWLSCDKLHVKAYASNEAVYDHFIRNERRQQLEYELEITKQKMQYEKALQSELDTAVTEQIKEQYSAVMDQLSSLQMSRRIDKSNNNAADKS